jgi:hypothetical protein
MKKELNPDTFYTLFLGYFFLGAIHYSLSCISELVKFGLIYMQQSIQYLILENILFIVLSLFATILLIIFFYHFTKKKKAFNVTTTLVIVLVIANAMFFTISTMFSYINSQFMVSQYYSIENFSKYNTYSSIFNMGNLVFNIVIMTTGFLIFFFRKSE